MIFISWHTKDSIKQDTFCTLFTKYIAHITACRSKWIHKIHSLEARQYKYYYLWFLGHDIIPVRYGKWETALLSFHITKLARTACVSARKPVYPYKTGPEATRDNSAASAHSRWIRRPSQYERNRSRKEMGCLSERIIQWPLLQDSSGYTFAYW